MEKCLNWCRWVSFMLVVWVMCVSRVRSNLTPNGTNVCFRRETFAQSYAQSIKQSVTQRISKKCKVQPGLWQIYKICYENRVIYQTAYRQMYRQAYRTMYMCCSGWAQSGNVCPIVCPSNKWGPGCNNTCKCQNHATCDMRTGVCTCTPGWQGIICDRPCDIGFYGTKCKQTCKCEHSARCDHVTGNCTCGPGWQGQRCNGSCDLGLYGEKCTQMCRCQNGAKCDHVTGSCACTPGWQGVRCEKSCDRGYYGNKCQIRCQCEHGACDHVNGTCLCFAGYIGERCDQDCPEGKYGVNCEQDCACSQNQLCSANTGKCKCRDGFTGSQCTTPCIVGSCNDDCPCTNNATCDLNKETCVCLPGYIGESCDQSCQVGYFGNRCSSKCSCHHSETCDPVNGNCTCLKIICKQDQPQKGKQTKDQDSSLLPGLLGGLVLLLLLSIAIGYLVYRRRNQRMNDNSKTAEPLYEVDELPQGENSSGKHVAARESLNTSERNDRPTYMELDGVSKKPKELEAPYQLLLTRIEANGLINKNSGSGLKERFSDSQYMGLGNPICCENESNYQPLQRDSVIEGDGRGLEENLYATRNDPVYINTRDGEEFKDDDNRYVNDDKNMITGIEHDENNGPHNEDPTASQGGYEISIRKGQDLEYEPEAVYMNVSCGKADGFTDTELQTYEVLPPTGHYSEFYDNE